MNSDTFNILYQQYYAQFVRFAKGYVRDTTIAEDIVVDSLIYYWENRLRLPADTNIPAYILTSIKHQCINYLRHISIRENAHATIRNLQQWDLDTRIMTLEACDPTELLNKEVAQIVRQTLNEFSTQTQQIFHLSRFEHKSHKEIATALKISTKTVEFHITKVLRRMRVVLKDYLIIALGILLHYLL